MIVNPRSNKEPGMTALSRTATGLALISIFALNGCVTANFVPTGEIYPPRSPDCRIEVFSSSLPERPYEELGIIEGEGSAWKADMEDVLPLLKEEACRAGGDAIILNPGQRYASGDEGMENLYSFSTVIRWKR